LRKQVSRINRRQQRRDDIGTMALSFMAIVKLEIVDDKELEMATGMFPRSERMYHGN